MYAQQLKVLAVAAPYWPCMRAPGTHTLGSKVPFSLQNACRLAAGMAKSHQGVWGQSNWATADLNDVVVMYDYAEDLASLKYKLERIQPNLLLIGAMTLALPGAVQVATMAKELLGDRVTTVLGGKHASETMYRDRTNILHNASSPLRLMAEGKIPTVFDVVVSGDGEHIIVELGKLVERYGSSRSVTAHVGGLIACPGNWIVGSLNNGGINTVASAGIPIDYDSLPIPAEVFGFGGSFDVFDADRTAHVYSDISRGCMYNCFFCTERRGVNGMPILRGSANRLFRQLQAVARQGVLSTERVSAFVEDSILLMGNVRELNTLYTLLQNGVERIPFGGQMTVDLLLRKGVQEALRRLKQVGLSYLFVGLETGNEVVALQMSKNMSNKNQGWMERNEQAVKFASGAGLKYGVSILFGLGESQTDRVTLLKEIVRWQKVYAGNPCVVSANWATQHPLLNVGQYDYTAWGTDAHSELLPLFQKFFGEASEEYLVAGNKPTPEDLQKLGALFEELNLEQ